jgi:hypothetical protein
MATWALTKVVDPLICWRAVLARATRSAHVLREGRYGRYLPRRVR